MYMVYITFFPLSPLSPGDPGSPSSTYIQLPDSTVVAIVYIPIIPRGP